MKHVTCAFILSCLVGLSLTNAYGQSRKIKVSYSTTSPSHAGLWMAKEAGLFEKYGVTIDLVHISKTGEAVVALLSGDISILFASAATGVNANLAGGAVSIVGGVENKPPFQVWVRQEIRSFQDLKGAKIGVTTPGVSLPLRLAFEKVNLNPTRDVQILELGSSPNVNAALRAGEIAGGALSFPINLEAKRLGFRQLLDLGEVVRDYAGLSILASHAFAKNDRELLAAFLKGYTEGVQRLYSDEEYAKRVITKYSQIRDREVVEGAYDHATRYIDRSPKPNIEAVRVLLEASMEGKPKAFSFKPDRFVDLSFYSDSDRGSSSSGSAESPPTVEKRVYNAWFEQGDRANHIPALLQTGQTYTLPFYIGKARRENLLQSKEVASALEHKALTEGIKLSVQLYCSNCSPSVQILELHLPPKGDSNIVAFTVRPVIAGSGSILFSVIYENATFDNLEIPIRVGTAGQLAKWEKEGTGRRELREPPSNTEINTLSRLSDYRIDLYPDQGIVKGWLWTPGAKLAFDTGLTLQDLERIRKMLWEKLHLIMNGSQHVSYSDEEISSLVFRPKTRDAILFELAKIGNHFYQKVFGHDNRIKEPMDTIKQSGAAKLTIYTTGFTFPWTLVNDEPVDIREPELEKRFKLTGFWGVRHVIEQGFNGFGKVSPGPIRNLQRTNVLMGVYNAEQESPPDNTYIGHRDSQTGWFRNLDPRVSTQISSEEKEFLTFLGTEGEKYHMIYFYTHASSGTLNYLVEDASTGIKTTAAIPTEDAKILLTPPPPNSNVALTPAEIATHGFKLAAPFIFINACESGTVMGLSTDSFVTNFIKKGARVLLVTEAVMWQNFAKEFAKELFTAFFAQNELGRSLLTLRNYYLRVKNNPFALLYTLYGDSTTALAEEIPFKPDT